jgi:hypothetical protein
MELYEVFLRASTNGVEYSNRLNIVAKGFGNAEELAKKHMNEYHKAKNADVLEIKMILENVIVDGLKQ